MNRNDSIRPLLQTWADDRLEPTSEGLLAQVMREVDTVSQRTTTSPSWLNLSQTALAAAAIVMVVLASAIGAYVATQVGSKTQVPGPAATADATPWQATASPTQIVDGLIATWNEHATADSPSAYAPDARLRLVRDDTEVVGRDDIAAWVDASSRGRLEREGAVQQQGLFLAVPIWVFWDMEPPGRVSSQTSMVWVLRMSDSGLVERQYVFSLAGDPRFGWDGPPSAVGAANDWIVQRFDAQLSALNRHDGEAYAAFFVADATWWLRDVEAFDRWDGAWAGRENLRNAASGSNHPGLEMHRTGLMQDVGSFVLYPCTLSDVQGYAKGFTVALLAGDYMTRSTDIIGEQWTIVERSAAGGSSPPDSGTHPD